MRRASSLILLALTALGVTGPTVASARPLDRIPPRPFATGVAQQAAGPPTLAWCEANYGQACYRPHHILTAYDLPRLYGEGNDGSGQTIVIVDSFGSPTIRADLRAFDEAFKLPAPPSFQIVQLAGKAPAYDPRNNDMQLWAFETTLDVEWAHAIAPGARLVLAETPVDETEGVHGLPQMMRSENALINQGVGEVISMSFAATEETFPTKTSLLDLRSAFTNARAHGVTLVAASGDTGPTGLKLDLSSLYQHQVNAWPSSDPLVTSVGGTDLALDATGARTRPDRVWNDGVGASGGGPSHVFARPAFQTGVLPSAGNHRLTPDVSMSAAVLDGVLIRQTFAPSWPQWQIIGGTSAAAPMFSGVVAIADQIAGHRLGWINPALYRLSGPSSGLVDITRGTNTFFVPGYRAVSGYDMASGLGTIDAWAFAHALAGR